MRENFLNLFKQFGDIISGAFSNFINIFTNFFDSVINLIHNISNFITGLYYGAGTLFTGLYDVVVDISSRFISVLTDSKIIGTNGFIMSLSEMIGGPATIIIFSLLVLAIIRIGFAFVLRIMRLNLDYRTLNKKRS